MGLGMLGEPLGGAVSQKRAPEAPEGVYGRIGRVTGYLGWFCGASWGHLRSVEQAWEDWRGLWGRMGHLEGL